jgi:hypothetical protein
MTIYKSKKHTQYDQGFDAGLRAGAQDQLYSNLAAMGQISRRPMDSYLGILTGMSPLDMMLGRSYLPGVGIGSYTPMMPQNSFVHGRSAPHIPEYDASTPKPTYATAKKGKK